VYTLGTPDGQTRTLSAQEERAQFALKSALLAALAAAAPGCLSDEHGQVRAAQSAYEACAAKYGEGDEQCQELRKIAREEFDRYEEKNKGLLEDWF